MFYLAQAGATLQVVTDLGVVTNLTLPSGVTIDSTRRSRIAVLNGVVYIVYAPSVSLWLDPSSLTLRQAAILPPVSAPTLAAGAGAGLTGAYQGKVSFAVRDSAGDILNESPLCDGFSNQFTASNNSILWSNIPISPDPDVNCRRLYRTLAGGVDVFDMLDIGDNTTTSIDSSMSDAALSNLPADPSIGNPPGAVPGTALRNIVQWKQRLWAVPDDTALHDHVRYTEESEFYAWNPENDIPVPPVGEDSFGITGMLARRDSLGLAKRDRLCKITGSSNTDFQLIIVVEGMGCVAQETCIVVRDVGYFLGIDGFYQWDDSGVQKISGPDVDPWFTTDTYFNRSLFPNAFASWNPFTNCVELALASAGSNNIDRWVSFNLETRKWLGPHLTSAFTPTCRSLLQNDAGGYTPAMGGSDGYIYLQNQATPSDVPGGGAAVAISSSVVTKFHAGTPAAPKMTHFWGRLAVLSRVESVGNLTATPLLVGAPPGSAGTPGSLAGLKTLQVTAQTFDLTQGEQIGARIGIGRMCAIQFSKATVGQAFLVYGYEFEEVFEIGQRT